MTLRSLLAALMLAWLGAGMASAQSVVATTAPATGALESGLPSPGDASDLIERMLSRNATLSSYESRVHVHLRMLNFPFLAPTLDGTSYFKRPDNYEVVFDRVPSYAKGFSKLFNDVGDPESWHRDQIVTFKGVELLNGHPMYVLYLTKKIHSDILDHTLVFVDPQSYALVQMEWHYTSGGSIVMTQQFHQQDSYSFVVSQHVTIDIPHVHAVGDSQYATYQTNVAFSDAVFSGKP
jgi:hypothetical protein